MYLVRQVKKNVFEVAKFEDRNFPVDVYTITNNKCNCPASWRSSSCKHRKLVDEFKKDTNTVYEFYLSATNAVTKTKIAELTFN
mgnify:CR=1 FL=1